MLLMNARWRYRRLLSSRLVAGLIVLWRRYEPRTLRRTLFYDVNGTTARFRSDGRSLLSNGKTIGRQIPLAQSRPPTGRMVISRSLLLAQTQRHLIIPLPRMLIIRSRAWAMRTNGGGDRDVGDGAPGVALTLASNPAGRGQNCRRRGRSRPDDHRYSSPVMQLPHCSGRVHSVALPGSLFLYGNNTYAGGTVLNTGSGLNFNTGNSFGTGPITYSSTLTTGVLANPASTAPVTINNATSLRHRYEQHLNLHRQSADDFHEFHVGLDHNQYIDRRQRVVYDRQDDRRQPGGSR